MTDRTLPGLQFGGVLTLDNHIIVIGVGNLPDGEPFTVGIELNKQQRALVRSRIERLDQDDLVLRPATPEAPK